MTEKYISRLLIKTNKGDNHWIGQPQSEKDPNAVDEMIHFG